MGEISVADIMNGVRTISHIVGGEWLKKGLKKEEAEVERLRLAAQNRKHAYIYKAEPHPLVGWCVEFEKWRDACAVSGRFELNESVVKLAVLGKNLRAVQYQNGFEKLTKRLKGKDSFFATAFEIEVAASYCAKNWSVQFIEEGASRTPDLRVVRDDGSHFYVECKCRDRLTERDKKVNAFWTDLEASLIRKISPAKRNVAVLIKSLQDPERSDLEGLEQFIMNSIDSGGLGSIDESGEQLTSVLDPTEKFQVIVDIISSADQVLEGDGIGLSSSQQFDRFSMHSEVRIDENGKPTWKNPFMIGMKNEVPSDTVKGIIHGLKSAVGQFPKDSPGVIWIRVPDNLWAGNLNDSLAKAEQLIRGELTGEINRGVNAVILLTKLLHPVTNGDLSGLVYKPVRLTVEHTNPLH